MPSDVYEEMKYLFDPQFLREKLNKATDPEEIKKIEREMRKRIDEWNKKQCLGNCGKLG
jgi:hypothetical protein